MVLTYQTRPYPKTPRHPPDGERVEAILPL